LADGQYKMRKEKANRQKRGVKVPDNQMGNKAAHPYKAWSLRGKVNNSQ
jgi:hypothetical protein